MINPHCKIESETGDDAAFINGVNNMVNSIAGHNGFAELYVIRIDNWFDHKWLNYSGKSVVPFAGLGVETSLKDEWRLKITVPPFNPARVLSVSKYQLMPSEESNWLRPLHKTKASNDNLHNSITHYTTNGLFVWYSSATEINKRGSIMVYSVQNGEVETFYAALKSDVPWKVTKVKGITPRELTALWNRS